MLLSRPYSYFCVFVLLLNFTILIWELISVAEGSFPNHPMFIILEVLVNLTLLIEIILRFLPLKLRYFRYWGHIFDCAVFILSIVAMVFFFKADSILKDVEEVFTILLVSCRYVIALMRVISFIKNQSSTITIREEERIEIHPPEAEEPIQDLEENSAESNPNASSTSLVTRASYKVLSQRTLPSSPNDNDVDTWRYSTNDSGNLFSN
uniref:Ion transport domain-containing protein n=1 Tax=Arcella intermedia TaxID=1963864 RepID=A0A6B2LEN4_9EUKA